MTPTPIAVLGSGRGTNFGAILAAVRDGRLAAEIRAVVSDVREAPILEKARAAGLPALWVPAPAVAEAATPEERRRLHDRRVSEALRPHAPRFLVLAGYMRVLSDELLAAYRDPRGFCRIVNVHPSLLPAFPGRNSYARAWAHGAALSGVTVHLVDSGVDEGPICAQESFAIQDCASPQEVERRGLAVEHRLYPATLAWVLAERFEFERPSGAEGRGRVLPRAEGSGDVRPA